MTLSDDLAKATNEAKALEAALAAATADDASDQAALDAALARVAELERQLAECRAADEFRVGVSPGRWLNYTPSDQQAQLDSMASCGISALRIVPEWSGLEPKAGEFRFDRLVEVCERAEATGFEVIIGPSYPPVHARVTPTERYSAPKITSVRTMAKALGVATAHLKSRRREWTNEPNLLYWVPPDPIAYAKTLDAFSTNLLAGDPAAEVISGGLAPAKQNPPRSWRGPEFLAAMYANAPKVCPPGKPTTLAGIGWHPYMGGNPPSTVASWSTMGTLWDAIVDVIESRPAPHPPIVSTEWGYSTGNPEANGTTPELQARYIVEQLQIFRDRPTAGTPFLHRWIDFRPGEFGGMTAYNEQLGVHWSSASVAESLRKPKPAVAAIREYLVG